MNFPPRFASKTTIFPVKSLVLDMFPYFSHVLLQRCPLFCPRTSPSSVEAPPGRGPAARLRGLRCQEDRAAATDRGHRAAEDFGHRSAQRGGRRVWRIRDGIARIWNMYVCIYIYVIIHFVYVLKCLYGVSPPWFLCVYNICKYVYIYIYTYICILEISIIYIYR